jgi:predicted hydrocarbon binding protein
VSPLLPLLLLRTMRDRDRPDEVMEDEDITLSLPRRLGLSEVVRVQIRRFEEEVRLKRPQLSSQVEDLVRLVIRRPDAEEIFTQAGRRVARHFWDERSNATHRFVRFLPRALALVMAQRAGKRMFRVLVGPTPFRFTRRPVSLRIQDTLSVRADPSGAACGFYSGALTELLELYTNRKYRVLHPSCASRVAGVECEWAVEIAS